MTIYDEKFAFAHLGLDRAQSFDELHMLLPHPVVNFIVERSTTAEFIVTD